MIDLPLSLTVSWSVIVDLDYSVDPQLGHVKVNAHLLHAGKLFWRDDR
jgi:hypothetical protein